MTRMKKYLALLLACLCLITVTPSSAFAEECEESGIATADLGTLEPLVPSCTHSKAFTFSGGYISSGSYYLTSNRSLSSTVRIQSGVTVDLCLNGYSLSGKNSFSMFEVQEGGVLNLYDCVGSGRITGGNFNDEFGLGGGVHVLGEMNMYGGTISGNTCAGGGGGVGVSGSFYMYGGTISGNTANTGAGVSSIGTFYMYGGNISGNSAFQYGGGLYQTIGSKVYIEGGSITGNTAASAGGGIYKDLGNLTFTYGPYIANNTVNGASNNVFLYNNQKIKIGYDGLYLGTTPIGITTMTAPTSSTPVAITNAVNTDYSSYFTSDNPSYGVRYNSGVMQIYVANFRYVYYNSNGGSGSMSTTQLSDGQVAITQENAFTKSGYEFVGWNTAADGSGTDYSPGVFLDPLADMTLYAQWEQITDYTILLPDGENIVVDPDTQSGTAGIGIKSGSVIPSDKSLQMSVDAGNYYSDGYKLRNQTGGQRLPYSLSYKDTAVDPGAADAKAILEVADSDAVFTGFERDISVKVGKAIASGTYTDVLTFSFAIV